MKILIASALASCSLMSACAPPQATMKPYQQVQKELSTGYKVFKPQGNGPFPTVLFLHGASDHAWQPGYRKHIEKITNRGYAVVFINSYSSRDLNGPALRGGSFLPPERAGDIVATLDWLRSQKWSDAERVAALGESHGATTILDTLVLAPPAKKPTGLKTLPSGGLGGLKAGVLYYPWCSGPVMGVELIKAVKNDWSANIGILGLLPDGDTESDVALCFQILKRHKDKGLPVEIVHYINAGHSFNHVTDDHGNQVATFDEKVTEDADRRMLDFLDKYLK